MRPANPQVMLPAHVLLDCNGMEMIAQDDCSINSKWVSRHHIAKGLPEGINVVGFTEDASSLLGDECEKICTRFNFCPPVLHDHSHDKGLLGFAALSPIILAARYVLWEPEAGETTVMTRKPAGT